MEQISFKFRGEETRKREKFDFGEMGFQREERESVAGFRNFEDKFVFWLYKRLKC